MTRSGPLRPTSAEGFLHEVYVPTPQQMIRARKLLGLSVPEARKRFGLAYIRLSTCEEEGWPCDRRWLAAQYEALGIVFIQDGILVLRMGSCQGR